MKARTRLKRTLILTAITIVCIVGLYTYLTWSPVGISNPSKAFMHHRYNKVVTEPLAKLGFADAQYKMGLFWFYGAGESEPTTSEIEKVISWWEKASAKGNEKAKADLAKAKEQLRIDSLAAKGMYQEIIIHLNTDKPYDAIIQTLYDADRNKYYFITSIKRNGRWEEIDSQLRDLEKEYSADRKPHIQELIRSLQERATHVADIDGELYLINI